MKNFTNSLLFLLFFPFVCFSQSIANYNIVFESFWESETNNPTHGISTIELPESAHWSPLVGATHKTENVFLMLNGTASAGIESIAETGSTSTFQTEVNTNSDADQYLAGTGLDSAKGTISINNINVREDFPLITLASMIAPSPDWFIAVNGINLRSGNSSMNNGWKATFTIDLYPYDAGTEDGNTYSFNNPATNPQGVITSLSNIYPFNANRIGTLTFTYNSSTLNTPPIKSIETIKVFPNPTQEKITISNPQNLELNTIEIYNILGRLVKGISIKNRINKFEIDLSTLSNGVYLLQLKTKNGKLKTEKLILN
ncbi:spondin domain-containing protein [Thalassobellus suaedae]|uniref:Spondin domain-containing protein n=1 Tax=Thalassobellus suaedae TaxID=3074124 RepID=A0ABY9Y112_9FLAO|nr:spondin domain-containing protein [Flavobacteriaceae bacterium HL-DH10]